MKHPNPPDEMLAVVDADDRETGSEPRRAIHEQNLLHRAVHVIVCDTRGRLLIQQRSPEKDTFPLHWECVGGHMAPGECYCAAGRRELKEELGVAALGMELVCKIPASEATGWEFIKVFRAVINEEPVPDVSEVIGVCWLSAQELREEIAACARPFSPVFVNTLRAARII